MPQKMTFFLRFLAPLALLTLSANGLPGANRILIKAVASEEFTKARVLDENKKIQTYQFILGRYFPGNVKDPSMEKITLDDIVENLAVHMQKQNFYPHRDPKEGDLLIVIHYGATDYDPSFEEMFAIDSLEDLGYTEEIASAGNGGTALDFSTIDAINNFSFNLNSADAMAAGNERSAFFKAQLLGMEEAFSNRTAPQDAYDLQYMLNEERYFIILMAYDYPLFKEGELKLHWSTRYSIRTIGQSFEQAIQDMNFVAADFFGKSLQGINSKRVTDRSRVDIGEIEVLGRETDEEETPKGAGGRE
ncbi:MAG: hypothetical protein F7B06_07050 [Opitutae bacterium]|nr:hypothetical protein [Opitutae bacterium]MBC9889595.1 hypothetical protein [Opitutae bacterium]